MSIHVYVDGESHYIRSCAYWKKLHGEAASDLQGIIASVTYTHPCYPDHDNPPILLEPWVKFFWDKRFPQAIRPPLPQAGIDGAVYYTDFSGEENDYHDMCVFIRNQGFDPQIISERKELADRRKNLLNTQSILEKPKGVDIGLTVRILEDAYRHIYDRCYLFTSDIDYLPVIGAIQRLGRKVVVFGYKDGMGNKSKLEFVPDSFIDLGVLMSRYEYKAEESVCTTAAES